MMRLRRALKVTAFALTPLLALTLTAEIAVRVKYFFQNDHDWAYLLTPFADFRKAPYVPPPPPDVRPAAAPSTATAPPSAPSDRPGVVAASQQMVFSWQKPCGNSMVYSPVLDRMMPRTWDANCFRGDHVSTRKTPGEYRIFFVGGSTVEDAQSDEEMMTAQFKRALRAGSRPVTVVNAGRAGFDSGDVLTQYDGKLAAFAPDLVVYSEGWNEQPTNSAGTRSWFSSWLGADRALTQLLRWRVHRALYYNSILYTYLVEKYELASSSRRESAFWREAHFWKIDVGPLRDHFTTLVNHVRRNGGQLIFVTQVIDWPRMWKGADTFDYDAVDRLLDRLRTDRHYEYDVREISALNQRLAIAYTVDLCRRIGVPVVDVRSDVEQLGERARHEMFADLGHRTVRGNELVGRLVAERLSARVP